MGNFGFTAIVALSFIILSALAFLALALRRRIIAGALFALMLLGLAVLIWLWLTSPM